MSSPKPVDKLVQDISRLLEKHEVHNELLAVELAIFMVQREKTAMKKVHTSDMNAIQNAK